MRTWDVRALLLHFPDSDFIPKISDSLRKSVIQFIIKIVILSLSLRLFNYSSFAHFFLYWITFNLPITSKTDFLTIKIKKKNRESQSDETKISQINFDLNETKIANGRRKITFESFFNTECKDSTSVSFYVVGEPSKCRQKRKNTL